MEHGNRDNITSSSTDPNLRGLAIATCCHHLCQWKSYISNGSSCLINFFINLKSTLHNLFGYKLLVAIFRVLQIKGIYAIWESQRNSSMQLHGLPVGQWMMIMAQIFPMLLTASSIHHPCNHASELLTFKDS